jgi:heme-degrading monooxygenase HmoA
MAHTVSKLTVNDYDTWKSDFDGNAARRRATGQRHYHVYRVADDPSQFLLLVEWESLEQARAFIGSDELKAAEERSGVTACETWFIEQTDRGTA